MKKIFFSILIIISVNLFAQVGLDSHYHTYEEIKAELDSLQNLFPEYVFVDSIGVTLTDSLPILAVKLSDNPEQDEDEPAVLYVGQCHAEEVLGNEITMYMINDILEHRYLQPYSIWLSYLEIWFIPSINPEGLQVVMDGWDTSFRKNKRDNNLNGIFDYEEGPGNDLDGVDLNRNYSFNWIHGDELWAPGTDQLYDYYRGPAPFSEGGTQAIRDFAEQQHFIFSINWHSSRTGNFSEKVFYSFEWDGEKRSPDFEVNQMVGETVASLIQTEDGTGNYEPSPSRGRKGNAHDWFYQAHGTTQLLIECGTSNLQPDSALVYDTCERCSAGAYWLLNRTLGYNADASMLTGHITDIETGLPLVAEVIVEEHHASYFEPRMSDGIYGRFWKVLMPGTYNLKIRKKAYEEMTINDVTVNNSVWTNLDIELIPLNSVIVNGTVTCDGNPISAQIVVYDITNDTIAAENGNFSFETFEGTHKIEITSEGCVPYIDTHEFVQGFYEMNITLLPEKIIFNETFENGLDNWQIIGNWCISEDAEHGNFSITDNPDEFYNSNSTTMITTINPINLNEVAKDVVLSFSQKYYTEYDNDICSIEISENGIDWEEIANYSGVQQNWERILLPLSAWINSTIYLRFKLTTDETLVDPGWTIDEIKIVSSQGVGTDEDHFTTNRFVLHQNYPNPFNSSTAISFNLAKNLHESAEIKIFNIKGQLVKNFLIPNSKSQIQWNGKDANGGSISNGIYLYKLESDGKQVGNLRKAILLK